ncbi:MAG: M20 aminoacylase family protein [Roseitalea porphyridii]|jgi:amidohydrolase|uniref:M20 aminoacylase family protein n=1 Tax=Roseitalea porphyridii TaxID=1852022 RepID=UPI0032EB18E7
MTNIDRPTIEDLTADMTEWRRHLHANPETAFEEIKTAAFIAEKLRSFGHIDVHEGLAKTGVVGVIKGLKDGPTIGFRADIDALDIDEQTNLPWSSKTPGKMHACGHDGHTAMLLGAAKYLAANRDFAGTAVFIFQPAEENEGGGRVMVEEGLFERFPMEQVYGLHNWPGMTLGQAGVRDGPVMASYDIFEISVEGTGGHAAMPHLGTDPILAAGHIVCALQAITSRRADPLKSLVVSCTQIHGGSTWNVIPNKVRICGTVRAFDEAMQDLAEDQITKIASNAAKMFEMEATTRYERRYPATVNHKKETGHANAALVAVLGDENVQRDLPPAMGAEDFAFMLNEKPGSYVWLGAGENTRPVHTPHYDFNDAVLPLGLQYWVTLARQQLIA